MTYFRRHTYYTHTIYVYYIIMVSSFRPLILRVILYLEDGVKIRCINLKETSIKLHYMLQTI